MPLSCAWNGTCRLGRPCGPFFFSPYLQRSHAGGPPPRSRRSKVIMTPPLTAPRGIQRRRRIRELTRRARLLPRTGPSPAVRPLARRRNSAWCHVSTSSESRCARPRGRRAQKAAIQRGRAVTAECSVRSKGPSPAASTLPHARQTRASAKCRGGRIPRRGVHESRRRSLATRLITRVASRRVSGSDASAARSRSPDAGAAPATRSADGARARLPSRHRFR
jgi:hypothetical protein